jgi:hypothetical protein
MVVLAQGLSLTREPVGVVVYAWHAAGVAAAFLGGENPDPVVLDADGSIQRFCEFYRNSDAPAGTAEPGSSPLTVYRSPPPFIPAVFRSPSRCGHISR